MEETTSERQKIVIPPLRKFRQDRGLTVDQIAILAGVNKATISRYERGLHQLNPLAIVKLSKALRVSVEKITG